MDTTLRTVVVETLGTALTTDAAIGATTLVGEDLVDFSEDGGALQLGDLTYEFTTADPETGIIVLSTALTEAAVAGDPVYVIAAAGTLAQEWSAHVEWADGEEAVPAIIPTDLIGYFPPGDDLAGATVSIRDDERDGYVVTSRPGEAGGFDLAFADTSTIPDRTPTAPPTEIFTVQVAGDSLGLTGVAIADNIDGTTSLDWYLDGVLKEQTRSTVVRFTTDAAGVALTPDTDYVITVQPRNVIGVGVLSDPTPGRLDPTANSTTVLAWVAAGFVLAGAIQVGTITLDPNTGLTIPLANGGLIQFPADGSDAVITAILRARSLVVEDDLRIQGTGSVVEGGVTVAAGVVAPALKPRASTSWDHTGASLTLARPTRAPYRRGLLLDGTKWISTCSAPLDYAVTGYDSTTGAASGPPDFAMPGGMVPLGGVTKLGSVYFVLTRDDNLGGRWFVRRYDAAWAYLSKWEFDYADTGGLPPAIASDGTSIWIARCALPPVGGTDHRLLAREFTTGGTLVGTAVNTPLTDGRVTLTGLYVGNADFGGMRIVATSTTRVMVTNTSGVRQSAQEWTPANGDQIVGLAWDGTRFHTLGASGKVWHYSTTVTTTTRSITHTWYDSVGTLHETDPSPALSYAQPARQWLRVDTDPPSYAGFPDDPNSVGVYIANKLQAHLAAGVTTAVYDVPTTGGAAAPTSNGFAAISAPGWIRSAGSDALGRLWSLDGSAARLAGVTDVPVPYTPTVTGVTSNFTVTGYKLDKADGTTKVWVKVVFTGTAAGSGVINVTLPSTPNATVHGSWQPIGTFAARNSSSGSVIGVAIPTGSANLSAYYGSTSTRLAFGAPYAWVNNTSFGFAVEYVR